MSQPPKKKCERCDWTASPGQRYCSYHAQEVIQQMRNAGYLDAPPERQTAPPRPRGAREDRGETRSGNDR